MMMPMPECADDRALWGEDRSLQRFEVGQSKIAAAELKQALIARHWAPLGRKLATVVSCDPLCGAELSPLAHLPAGQWTPALRHPPRRDIHGRPHAGCRPAESDMRGVRRCKH